MRLFCICSLAECKSGDIRFYPKVNQIIYFSVQNSMPYIKDLAHILFEITCMLSYFSTLEKDYEFTNTCPPEKKKMLVSLFFKSNWKMKSQNPSIYA